MAPRIVDAANAAHWRAQVTLGSTMLMCEAVAGGRPWCHAAGDGRCYALGASLGQPRLDVEKDSCAQHGVRALCAQAWLPPYMPCRPAKKVFGAHARCRAGTASASSCASLQCKVGVDPHQKGEGVIVLVLASIAHLIEIDSLSLIARVLVRLLEIIQLCKSCPTIRQYCLPTSCIVLITSF